MQDSRADSASLVDGSLDGVVSICAADSHAWSGWPSAVHASGACMAKLSMGCRLLRLNGMQSLLKE
jgi:hypothetical protein